MPLRNTPQYSSLLFSIHVSKLYVTKKIISIKLLSEFHYLCVHTCMHVYLRFPMLSFFFYQKMYNIIYFINTSKHLSHSYLVLLKPTSQKPHNTICRHWRMTNCYCELSHFFAHTVPDGDQPRDEHTQHTCKQQQHLYMYNRVLICKAVLTNLWGGGIQCWSSRWICFLLQSSMEQDWQ